VGLTKHRPLDHHLPRPSSWCRGLFAPSDEYQWIICPVADTELFGSMSVVWRELELYLPPLSPEKESLQISRIRKKKKKKRKKKQEP